MQDQDHLFLKRRLSQDDTQHATKRIPLIKRLEYGIDDMIGEQDENEVCNH
jgi:hypothetical protein